jgi:glycerate 2-kinase
VRPLTKSMRIGVRDRRIRALLGRLLRAGLAAADQRQAVRRIVARTRAGIQVAGRRYNLRGDGKIVAAGAGKAAASMALALEQLLGTRLTGGLIAVKRGYALPTRLIRVVTAGHPVPDRAGQRAAARMLALAKGLTRDDLLILLLSGGASSLLPLPAPGLTLADKQRTSQLLLKSGATIREINIVRKHLSAIKGGRLAAATQARVVALVLSDVIGDDLGTIGSGPTAPDPTTYADACATLRRFRIWNRVPVRVRRHLLKGRHGGLDETPKPGAARFRRVRHHLLGNNRAVVEAVRREALRAGFRPHVLPRAMTGNVRSAAASFGRLARRIVASGKPVRPPACLIAGGELTVTVRGAGRGGRAQEFALAAAMDIAGLPNVWIAGVGTDGTDGPTDAAGAVVDGGTLERAKAGGLDAARFLRRNDAHAFFKQAGGHIVTGPTGTNVNDLYLMIVR